MRNFILSTTILLSISACADQARSQEALALRNFECPPGCVCSCEPIGTSSSSGSGESSSEASSSGSTGSSDESSGSSGSQALGVYAAIEAMGAVPHDEAFDIDPATGEQYPTGIWGTYPDGRRFRVVYPAENFSPEAPGSDVRVLFAFHASGSTNSEQYPNARAGGQQWDSYHWGGNGNFMVVLPEAQDSCWRSNPADPTDFYHVQRVVQGVEAWSFVDPTRRYIQGWSSGGFMSQSVACEMGADVVIAGAGSLRHVDGCDAVGELPVSCANSPEVYLHQGRFDQRVPLQLGQDGVDRWASLMGCTNPQPTSEPLDWCSHQYEECDESATEYTDGCVRYDCAEGGLTWCLDSSGTAPWYHSQQGTGRILRDVGEIIFNQ